MKAKSAKKSPADYPQMIFRVNQSDKDRIHSLVESVQAAANESLPDEAKKFRKNDVIVDALLLGLLTLEKRYAKKTKYQA